MTIQKLISSKIESRTKKKVLATGVLVAGMMAASLIVASPAHASTTFTVNLPGDTKDANTSDNLCDVNLFGSGNQCTLRAAIEQANATPGADTINFDIPDNFGTGVKTINVGATGNGALPNVTDQVNIDGYTQPGAHPNTKALGNDAVIRIELNGASAGAASGLGIDEASNGVIRGLAINRFSGSGIVIFSDPSSGPSALGNRIEGNFVGTDPSGVQDLGNGGTGVNILNSKSNNNIVGGTSPAARNLISGNDSDFGGVLLHGGTAGNQVLGNYIGTDRTGTEDLGNLGHGVVIFDSSDSTVGGITAGAHNLISGNEKNGVEIAGVSEGNNRVLGNRIGTTASGIGALGNGGAGVFVSGSSDNNSVGSGTAGAANAIAFNGQDGVSVTNDTTGNRILSNSVFSNGRLGVDLNDDGSTSNDAGDADAGPNTLQNFPALSSAKASRTGTTIKGTLNSTPSKTFTVQFFSNAPGADEGQTLLGEKSVTTDTSGNASFTFKTKKKVGKGQTITATATDSDGNTSEFSRACTVG